jgi:hypothetical protein
MKNSRPMLMEQYKEMQLTYAQTMLERIEEEVEINFYEDEEWAFEES